MNGRDSEPIVQTFTECGYKPIPTEHAADAILIDTFRGERTLAGGLKMG